VVNVFGFWPVSAKAELLTRLLVFGFWLLACLGESGAFDEIIGFWFIRSQARLKIKPS